MIKVSGDVDVVGWDLVDGVDLANGLANEIVQNYIDYIQDDIAGFFVDLDDEMNLFGSLLVGSKDERLITKEPLNEILECFVWWLVNDDGVVDQDDLSKLTSLKQILDSVSSDIDKIIKNNP